LKIRHPYSIVEGRDGLENYQVFKRKPSPFLWKHINLHRTIIFVMTSDVLGRKLNKENQICNSSSFFNEKGILIEIWYSMNFCVKNVFWPLTLISEKLHNIFFWRPNYFESTNIAESNDIWHSRIVNIEKYVFYKININNSQIIMRNISFVHIDLCWYMSNWQH
jgi:hypothetical protein